MQLRWNFCKRDKYKRDEQYDWLNMAGRTGDHEDLIGVQRPKHPVGEYIYHPLSSIEHKRGNPFQAHLYDAEGGAEDSGDEVFHDAPEDLDERGYTSDQHRRPEAWLDDEKKKLRHLHRPKPKTDKSLPQLPEEAQKRDHENSEPQHQEHTKMTGNNPKTEGTISASGGVHEKEKGYASNIAGLSVAGGHGTVRAQVVRSSADWSSGILTEQSIQNAYCEVIRGAQHYVYIENQFFITATGENQAPVHNLIGKAIVDACVRAAKEDRKFRVIILIPCIPGFAGDLRSDAAAGTRAIMDYQYKSICRGEHSIYGQIKAAGVDPEKYIFVFNLRSYDRINNTPALKKLQEQAGISYQEMQRAEAEEIMNEGVHGAPGEKKMKKTKKSKGEGKKAAHKGQPTDPKSMLKYNIRKEAESSESESDLDNDSEQDIASGAEKKQRFESQMDNVGLAGEAMDESVMSTDSIAKDALLAGIKPSEENYAGRKPGEGDGDPQESREQEVENFIQEELYIHGKVCSTTAAWEASIANISSVAPDSG